MKKVALTAAGLALLIGTSASAPARATVATPGAAVAYLSGNGAASPGLTDPLTPGSVTWSTNLSMTGQATGQGFGKHGLTGLSGVCSFSVTESASSTGRLTGGCEGGLNIGSCNMAWVRTGFQGVATGRCVVQGSSTALTLELSLHPTTIRPVTSFTYVGTFTPVGVGV